MERAKRLLEFLLALALFLPVTFQAIFRENVDGFGDITLRWGISVATIIFSLLLVEFFSSRIPRVVKRFVIGLSVTNIFSYIIVLTILGTKNDGALDVILILPYQIALVSLYLLPLFISLLLICGVLFKFLELRGHNE